MSKSIFKNTIYKALLNLTNIVIPIIIGPYANRIFGPALIGDVNSVDSFYGYFMILAAFGIYNYGLREISRIRGDKEKVSRVFTSLFVIGLIANIIASCLYFSFIFLNFRQSDIFPIFFIYGINIMTNIFYVEWVTEAFESYDFIAAKALIVRIIYIILLFTLVKTSDNIIQYVCLLTLSLFLNNIISFIYISRKIKFNFKEINLKIHGKLLLISAIMSNANVLYTQLDRVMMYNFVNAEANGYYGTAQNVMSMVNTLILSVILVTIPRLSNVLVNENEEAYETLLNKIIKVYFTLLFPAAVGIFVLSPEIIYYFGKEAFFPAIKVLKIYAVYMITCGIESIFTNQIIYVKRKDKILVVFIFIGGLFNLVLKILLVNFKLLMPSTAIATTLLANLSLITMEYIYIKRRLKVNVSMFNFDKIKYLLISLIFIPVTSIIRHYIGNYILVMVAAVIVNVAIYLAVLLLIKDPITAFILDKLNNLRKRA